MPIAVRGLINFAQSDLKVGEAITKATDPMLFDLTVNSIFGTPFGPIEDNITVFNPNKNSIQQNAPVIIGINADEPVPFLNMIFHSRALSKGKVLAIFIQVLSKCAIFN